MTPDRNAFGAKGGGQSVNLAVNQIPPGVPSANAAGIAVNVTGSTASLVSGAGSANVAGGGNPIGTAGSTGSVSVTASGTLAAGAVSVTSTNASLQPVNKMPPTILCNYIMQSHLKPANRLDRSAADAITPMLAAALLDTKNT